MGFTIMGLSRGERRAVIDVSPNIRRLASLLEKAGVEVGATYPLATQLLKATLSGEMTYVEMTSRFGVNRLEILDVLTRFEDSIKRSSFPTGYRLRYCSIDPDSTMLLLFDAIVEETCDALERYFLQLQQEGESIPAGVQRFIRDFKEATQI